MTARLEAAPRTTRDVAVLVPAGGLGARLGSRTPKQFLSLAGAPILAMTLARLASHPRVAGIVVAAPEQHVALARRILAGGALVAAADGRGSGRTRADGHAGGGRYTRSVQRRQMVGAAAVSRTTQGRVEVAVVAGGATRQESVWRALQAAPAGCDIVVVHDAVRPFVTFELVEAVVDAARTAGAAICALPIAETVKRVRAGIVEATLDRSELWAVQTPQAFAGAILREAHEKALRDGFVGTDEAMLVERLGHPVRVVPGLEANIKITTAGDLRRARAWIGR